jgi:hypothetical protein
MLSQLTPLSERLRGHRYSWSVAWYLVGATLGGICLGGGICVLSVLWSSLALGRPLAIVGALVVVLLCAAADARILGVKLPDRPRQVDESWIDRYRPWVYAGSYGWQVGTGISTYVMTNATYALVVAGGLLLSPLQAILLGTLFGASRGAFILLGARGVSPERLRALHARLAATSRASLWVAIAAQFGVAIACAAAVTGVSGKWVAGSAVVLVGVACLRGVRSLRPSLASA